MNQLYLDLCKVKALLVAGWGQGRGRDETRLCLSDACCQVQWDDVERYHAITKAIYTELFELGAYGMVDWNDHPARTKAEVIDLVQRAVNRASAEC